MNTGIVNKEVQRYIHEHVNDDIVKIALSKSPFKNVSSRELAEQIDSKKRCEKKLQQWFTAPGIYYPPKLAVEQASSELTAAYKSKLSKGDTVIDLTGGMGVDSHYFSETAKQVTHCEINTDLSVIAAYNSARLGSKNINFLNVNGIDYLKNHCQGFDTVYIDPARRANSKKVFFLNDCEPDVVENLAILLERAERIIIKTSPLLDISSGVRDLKHIREIHIISVKNDCKELLWVIDRGYAGAHEIICSALGSTRNFTFSFYPEEEKQTDIEFYSAPLKYVYEPDVVLLKAGCFKLITKAFNVAKLHANTHLYTSDKPRSDFMGRIFEVRLMKDYKAFGKEMLVKKANILSRNFPLSPAELKKKHQLEDGGDDYLIFTRTSLDSLIVILATRV